MKKSAKISLKKFRKNPRKRAKELKEKKSKWREKKQNGEKNVGKK